MQNPFKSMQKRTKIAILSIVFAFILVMGVNSIANAEISGNFWQKRGNGQLYTTPAGLTINVGACNGCGGAGGTFTNANPTPFTVGGIAAGSTFVAQTLQQMFDALLYPYQPPTTTLGLTPAGGLREKGNTVTNPALASTTTAFTNPIIAPFEFKKNAVVIFTDPAPNPAGGAENYVDPSVVSTNTTYTAHVTDGTQAGTATSSYTFISAYYYGVGAPGLTPAQVSALTKDVQGNTATENVTTSPTNEVYYFAYPDSYPALTSIIDNNGFETISDYTVTTGNNITNSFGDTDTYRIYEFNNLTTQVNFTNSYRQ